MHAPNKIFVLGLGMGVPFFSAGCSMFVACYASCCCLAGFRATVANQLRIKDDAQDTIASENSEYTEGRLALMLDQQAQLQRSLAEKSPWQSPSQGVEVTSFLGTREKVDFPTIIPYETFNTATGFVAGGSIGRGTLGINGSGIVGRTGSFSDLLQAQIDRLTLEVQSMEELCSRYLDGDSAALREMFHVDCAESLSTIPAQMLEKLHSQRKNVSLFLRQRSIRISNQWVAAESLAFNRARAMRFGAAGQGSLASKGLSDYLDSLNCQSPRSSDFCEPTSRTMAVEKIGYLTGSAISATLVTKTFSSPSTL